PRPSARPRPGRDRTAGIFRPTRCTRNRAPRAPRRRRAGRKSARDRAPRRRSAGYGSSGYGPQARAARAAGARAPRARHAARARRPAPSRRARPRPRPSPARRRRSSPATCRGYAATTARSPYAAPTRAACASTGSRDSGVSPSRARALGLRQRRFGGLRSGSAPPAGRAMIARPRTGTSRAPSLYDGAMNAKLTRALQAPVAALRRLRRSRALGAVLLAGAALSLALPAAAQPRVGQGALLVATDKVGDPSWSQTVVL